MHTTLLSDQALRRLLDAGPSVVSELDVEAMLDRVLETAAELTGASYAALGILDTPGAPGSEPARLRTSLGVPIMVRGEPWGNLYLCDKAGGDPFGPDDEEAAVVLAEWAAIAIENARPQTGGERRRAELQRAVRRLAATGAIAHAVGAEQVLESLHAGAATRTVEEQRLHDAMGAAEDARKRWARELHDETLQGLGGLRILLTAAARGDDPALRSGVAAAMQALEEEIDALRGLIRELRPAALDELGAAAAIEGLAARISERDDVDVRADVRLAAKRYAPELETAIYRIVQEAVTNAVRHADAEHIAITVEDAVNVVHVHVRDDGGGFDPGAPNHGFGLTGMRERVAFLRGEFGISSSPDGTAVTAAIPAP